MDRVVVEDDRGEIGSGIVIGRSFAKPMKYDVKIDDTIYASLPHGTLRYVQ